MQFDVYATPGRARDVFPYLVDVQSDLASEFSTRYVVPLLPVSPGVRVLQRANPVVEFAGQDYLFAANQLVNLTLKRLGSPLGNLSRYREEMIAAIDFMIVGI